MFKTSAGLFLATFLAMNSPADAARIAYFNDPTFVDMTQEGTRLQTALQSAGHTLTLFQGTASTAWSSALAGNDVLVIPELEVGDLFNALPVDTRRLIVGYVVSGNGLLTIADINGNATLFLNTMFGLGINFAVPSGATALNGAGVAGTSFAGGPATLPNSTTMSGHTTASLPSGALSVYAVAGVSSVFTTTVGGRGRIACLGFDWFESPPPAAWNDVLNRSVTHVEGATTNPLRIAIYEDGTFVDLAVEVAHLRTALEPMGHQLNSFVGTGPAVWRAALAGVDILILPENDFDRPDLLSSLPVGTRAVIAEFVLSGRGLVIHADFFATTLVSHSRDFLNGIFGFALVSSGFTSNNSLINLPDANGTAFSSGPGILPGPSAVTGVTTASLPAPSRSIYRDGANTTVFTVQRGFGQIVYFGYDWFTEPSPLSWNSALACAIEQATIHGEIPPVTPVAENTNAVVSIDLSGFQGLSAATLQFRAGGDANFTAAPMLVANPASSTANIPAASVTRRGIQAFVELSDGLNPGVFPPDSPESGSFLNIPVSVPSFTFASLPARGFRLAGVPMQAANPDPVAVFDELGPYNRAVWRYGTFDPVANVYNEPPSAAPATPGQGFWIISRDGKDVAASGVSTNLSGTIELTLRPGFNQISNPYAFPVSFADVDVPAEVESNLIAFDGAGYLPGITVMNAGTGYWIRNNSAVNQILSIPAIGSVGALASAPNAQRIRSEGASVIVRIDGTVGEFHDHSNYLGLRPDALEGHDAFDRFEPPVPPEGWVRVHFTSDQDASLLEDWRPDAVDGASWNLSFASDQAGRAFSIALKSERELPEGWGLAAFEGSREVNLGAPARITGVVGTTTSEKTWKISVGNAAYLQRARLDAQTSVTTFALGNPFPNPSPTGFVLDFAVPRNVDASAQIFDVRGRLVTTMHQGALEPGIHRFAWDGSQNSGERSAAGVYFLKVSAAEFSTVKKLVLLERRAR